MTKRVADHDQETDSGLLESLVCPLTKGPLKYHANEHELVSRIAGIAYPIRDGIPIMVVSEARELTLDEKEAL